MVTSISLNRNDHHEACVCCSRPIRAGHPFITCNKCDCIMHKKCKTTSNIIKFREQTYCSNCIELYDIIRYNPLYQPPHLSRNEFLDDEPLEYVESLDTISQILENCCQYSFSELNTKIRALPSSPNKKIFSTYFFNIDGNATNFDNFAIDMAQFTHPFSIIGIAETNVDPCNGQLYQLSNYTSCYQNRFFCENKKHTKAKGTGVCLYVHNDFNFTILNEISVCKKNIETLFVKITNLPEPIIVGVIYRPPDSSNPITEFNAQLNEILSKLENQKVYMLGDYNINLFDLEDTSKDQFQELLYTKGFAPLVSIATHKQSQRAKTCIDNIYTNDIDSEVVSGVVSNSKLTGHRPVFQYKHVPCSPEAASKKPQAEKVTTHYDYSNANLEKLCEIIKNDINTFQNKCDNFNQFASLFQDKIDLSCKLKTPKTSKRNSITNPWITSGLINSIDKKARLYKEWCKTRNSKTPDGDCNKYIKYKEYRSLLKHSIKHAKSNHYKTKFEEHSNNPRKTWQVINELRGKAKASVKSDFVIDSVHIMCRRKIANKFNEYFASLASKLNNNLFSETNDDGLPVEHVGSFNQYLSKAVESSIFMEDTSVDEVMEIINGFENGKSSDIPVIVLKKSANLISPTLVRLYNNCMTDGIFPTVFKKGKISPIFKKGNKASLENYRPISTLPIFGKIFEKIIYKRLYNFLTSKGILHDNQFGFRKGHSTSHALHESVDAITKANSDNKHVIGIFIDLSKAFDTIDHKILLDKLENSGIRGQAHELLKSYLTDRTQYVSFSNEKSDLLNVKYGVPQGSVLGPLLFLLYINDIVNCYLGPDCRFVLYADDTNIFVTGPSKESTYIKANFILERVVKFMKDNLLHINMDKCCFMHFKPTTDLDTTCARARPFAHSFDPSRAIFINGKKVKKVVSTKFLGVFLDEKLDWSAHLTYLTKKLRSVSGAICRIRKSIPVEYYKTIYTALFESHLSFGISVWGVALKQNGNDKILITQKHATRVLFGDLDAYLDKLSTCARAREYGKQKLGSKFYTKEHTKPILNRLKLLTVQNIHKYHSVSELFKIMKFRVPYSLYEKINISVRDTSNLIILPKPSPNFFYESSKMWNSVHKNILVPEKGLLTSISLVKHKLKTILLESQSLNDPNIWTPDNFQLKPPKPTYPSNMNVANATLYTDPLIVNVI